MSAMKVRPPVKGRSPELAREQCRCALLLIDVINTFEFPGGERLLRRALPMAQQLASLKRRARKVGIPVVYVNDNFGRWRSDFHTIVDRCLRAGTRGRSFVERLLPDEQDYFVLKPMNSGFFATTLEVLLRYLNADTLILTGLATDNCVLFTAHDAYLRDFDLVVPADCSAACSARAQRRALEQIATRLKADIRPASALRMPTLLAR